MKNIYNKGKYRFYDYGSLPPYLKRQGNKRWRKTESEALDTAAHEISGQPFRKVRYGKRKPKKIKVRIIQRSWHNSTRKWYHNYHSIKALEDSVMRNKVLSFSLIESNDMPIPKSIQHKQDRSWSNLA